MTLQDCMERYEKEGVETIINDGAVENETKTGGHRKKKKEGMGILFWICLLAVLVLFTRALYLGGNEIYRQNREAEKKLDAIENQTGHKKVESAVKKSLEPDAEEIKEEIYWDSMEMLAVCVEAEAGNQPLEGRRMAADVILNRADHPGYPDTIPEVIGQPYRFSSYWDGNMDSITEPSEETIRAVQMELEQRSYPGILHFQEGGYSRYGTPWRRVGDHYFSTE